MRDPAELPTPGRFGSWPARHWVLDALLGVSFLTIGATTLLFPHSAFWGEEPGVVYRSTDAFAWVAMLLLCVPVFFRRRYPATVCAVGFVGLAGLLAGDYFVGTTPFFFAAMMYAVGAYSTRRRALLTVGLMLAALVVTQTTDYPGFGTADATRNGLFFGLFLVVGRFTAARRHDAAQKLALAEERVAGVAEREHTAVVEERLRLAQELHDIVAHSMSVISVQAAMGSAAFDEQPEQTRRALDNIERTSRETLAELRGLLGVLRRDDGRRVELVPAPSLRDVGQLAANLEAVGVATEVVIGGPLVLPLGADAFAFRIVQEALTNVLKHAHATKVSVQIHDDDGQVTLRIRDDGRGSVSGATEPAGHGIIGMLERVAAFGGTLRAGSAPGGGFEVCATIPYATNVSVAQ